MTSACIDWIHSLNFVHVNLTYSLRQIFILFPWQAKLLRRYLVFYQMLCISIKEKFPLTYRVTWILQIRWNSLPKEKKNTIVILVNVSCSPVVLFKCLLTNEREEIFDLSKLDISYVQPDHCLKMMIHLSVQLVMIGVNKNDLLTSVSIFLYC